MIISEAFNKAQMMINLCLEYNDHERYEMLSGAFEDFRYEIERINNESFDTTLPFAPMGTKEIREWNLFYNFLLLKLSELYRELYNKPN